MTSSPSLPMFAMEPVVDQPSSRDWNQGQAVVRKVRGQAWFATANGPRPLPENTLLYPGAAIRTGPHSTVDLYLGINGPVLRLSPGTEIGLAALRFTDTTADAVVETRLKLRAGELYGSVRKHAQASNYEVLTPSNRIAIRGTDFRAFSSGNLAIIKGLAIVYPDQAAGPGITVSTGEFLETAANQARMMTRSEFDQWAGPIYMSSCPIPDISLVYGEWPARSFN